MNAIRTSKAADIAAITELDEVAARSFGQLAAWFPRGIFDAEGGRSSAIRISNTDDAMIGWTHACLRHFGFDVVVEDLGARRTAAGTSGCAAG